MHGETWGRGERERERDIVLVVANPNYHICWRTISGKIIDRSFGRSTDCSLGIKTVDLYVANERGRAATEWQWYSINSILIGMYGTRYY